MAAKRAADKYKQAAADILPRYKADNDPLTEREMEEIRRAQPPGRIKVRKSLF